MIFKGNYIKKSFRLHYCVRKLFFVTAVKCFYELKKGGGYDIIILTSLRGNIMTDKKRGALRYKPSEEYLSSEFYAKLRAIKYTGDDRSDVMLTALSQLGYHEGDCDRDMDGMNTEGSKNFVEYNRHFGKLDNDEGNGISYGYAWCCAFVTWTTDTTGIARDTVPIDVTCTRLAALMDKKGCFEPSVAFGGSYIPRTADLIFFRHGENTHTSHIGLVLYCDGERVYTVEGNTGGAVRRRDYALSDSSLYGFGTPKYSEDSAAAIDFSLYCKE